MFIHCLSFKYNITKKHLSTWIALFLEDVKHVNLSTAYE